MIIKTTTTMSLPDGNEMLVAYPEVIDDLYKTNCAVPDPVLVTYNLGKKIAYETDKSGKLVLNKSGKKIKTDEYDVLTTIVAWADGTKTVVQNSKADGLQLDKNGKPTVFSKECGFVFALAKRIMAGKIFTNDEDCSLSYEEKGFGGKLTKIVNSALMQNELNAQKLAEKKLKQQKKPENAKTEAKPQPSLRNCVKELQETIEMLKSELSAKVAKTGGKKNV